MPDTYDINIDGAIVRMRLEEGAAVIVDSAEAPGVKTMIGPGLFLLSGPRAANVSTVYIVDVDCGIAYASICPPAGSPRHVKGTIQQVK